MLTQDWCVANRRARKPTRQPVAGELPCEGRARAAATRKRCLLAVALLVLAGAVAGLVAGLTAAEDPEPYGTGPRAGCACDEDCGYFGFKACCQGCPYCEGGTTLSRLGCKTSSPSPAPTAVTAPGMCVESAGMACLSTWQDPTSSFSKCRQPVAGCPATSCDGEPWTWCCTTEACATENVGWCKCRPGVAATKKPGTCEANAGTRCLATWTDPGMGGTCGQTQRGCPAAGCDPPYGQPWCCTDAGCEGADDGWCYCTPGVAGSKEPGTCESNPGKTCLSTWTDAAMGGTCGETQNGCPSAGCDPPYGQPWCCTDAGCEGEDDGWCYCTPS